MHISSGVAAGVGQTYVVAHVGRHWGGRVGMAETYQEGLLLSFEGHMTKTCKRVNTEPQGIPEALDRFFGKLIQCFTIFHDNNVHPM